MKTIVFLDGQKHSAWWSVKEAEAQVSVLENYGYINVTFQIMDHNYEDGYYFI